MEVGDYEMVMFVVGSDDPTEGIQRRPEKIFFVDGSR